MKLYAPGDKSKAICEKCAKLVSTTFGYHDVPFSDGVGFAHEILAATCDNCGEVVSVPAQSTPAIKKARDHAESSLEFTLPAPEMEILDAAAFLIDRNSTTRFRKTIFAYYLNRLDEDQATIEKLTNGFPAWTASFSAIKKQARQRNVSVPTKRLSMKIAARTEERLFRVMKKSGLSKTDVARGIVMLAKHDVLDVEKINSSSVVRELKILADVVNG